VPERACSSSTASWTRGGRLMPQRELWAQALSRATDADRGAGEGRGPLAVVRRVSAELGDVARCGQVNDRPTPHVADANPCVRSASSSGTGVAHESHQPPVSGCCPVSGLQAGSSPTPFCLATAPGPLAADRCSIVRGCSRPSTAPPASGCPSASPDRYGGRRRGLSPRPAIWRLMAPVPVWTTFATPDEAFPVSSAPPWASDTPPVGPVAARLPYPGPTASTHLAAFPPMG
jgi:hypothetical protein